MKIKQKYKFIEPIKLGVTPKPLHDWRDGVMVTICNECQDTVTCGIHPILFCTACLDKRKEFKNREELNEVLSEMFEVLLRRVSIDVETENKLWDAMDLAVSKHIDDPYYEEDLKYEKGRRAEGFVM